MAHSCRHCRGSGRSTCPRCGGHGTMADGKTCYYCNGDTKVECPACDGSGTIED